MKKTLSLILVLGMLVGTMPQMTLAAWDEENSGAAAGFQGKTVSIMGDSISTFAGVSNDGQTNATLSGGWIFYNEGTLGVSRKDTWWQQTIDALGMELLVNNSWSGSCIFNTRSNTVGAYVDRCVQLHNNAGKEPDIIAVYLGTNDFCDYKDILGKAQDINYSALITDLGGAYTYAAPETTVEAYAIMLHKMTQRYPNADIYCFTLLPQIGLSAANQLLLEQFNESIGEIAAHFEAEVVDIYSDSGIKADQNFQSYITDNSLHPGPLGMDAITDLFVKELLEHGAPGSCNHVYEMEVTPPTCTDQGYTTYTCDCGHSYVDDSVAALGHGYSAGLCTVCGKDTVTASLEENSLTLAGELADGTHILIACYDSHERLTQVHSFVWQGNVSSKEISAGESVRLFFVDEDWQPLRPLICVAE